MNLSDTFRREKRATYLVKTGMDFRGKRAEPGELCDDIPAQSVPWLLKSKAIELVEEER